MNFRKGAKPVTCILVFLLIISPSLSQRELNDMVSNEPISEFPEYDTCLRNNMGDTDIGSEWETKSSYCGDYNHLVIGCTEADKNTLVRGAYIERDTWRSFSDGQTNAPNHYVNGVYWYHSYDYSLGFDAEDPPDRFSCSTDPDNAFCRHTSNQRMEEGYSCAGSNDNSDPNPYDMVVLGANKDSFCDFRGLRSECIMNQTNELQSKKYNISAIFRSN